MNDSVDNELELYGVDFSHLRLTELVKLADQAEPFYLWVERIFRQITGRSDALHQILESVDQGILEEGIQECFRRKGDPDVPKLFNGVGVAYPHDKACYLFFAWIVRDAGTQRLQPLLTSAYRQYREVSPSKSRRDLESEVFSKLIVHYRASLSYFTWPVIREVFISRLEGSRRAARGSQVEVLVRTALAQSITYFYKINGNYGSYLDVVIYERPLKVKNRTYDVVAALKRKDGSERLLVLPVKTRETQGGGHAHLFTRDIEQANDDIRSTYPDAFIAPVVIAENWSENEKDLELVSYDDLFHFPVNPNVFSGFTSEEQVHLNRMMEALLA